MFNRPETVQPRDQMIFYGHNAESHQAPDQLMANLHGRQLWSTSLGNDGGELTKVMLALDKSLRAVVVNADCHLEGAALEQLMVPVRAGIQLKVPGVIVITGEDSQQLPPDVATDLRVLRFPASGDAAALRSLLPQRYRTLAVNGRAGTLKSATEADMGIVPGQELVRASDAAHALEIIESINAEIDRVLIELGAQDTPAGQDIIGAAANLRIPTIGVATRAATGSGELMINPRRPHTLLEHCEIQ